MAEQRDGFLKRWSETKQATGVAVAEHTVDEARQPAAGTVEQTALTAEEEAEIVAQLPDIDKMDKDSDFSVFLKEGVPDILRRKALRKLWRLNPAFAVLDGLNDYDEDFNDITALAEGVKTIYKVGKGMLTDEDETKPEPARTAEPLQADDDIAESEVSTPAESEALEALNEPTANRLADGPEKISAPPQRQAQPATAETPIKETPKRRSALHRRWSLTESWD